MALVQCPGCGNDISDTVRKCPHCGRKLKKEKSKIKMPVIICIVVVLVGTLAGFVWMKNREEKIQTCLAKVNELYSSGDFDGVEKCYDSLDELHYNTSSQRVILEYDRSVYPAAYAYYKAINDVDEKLHTGNYYSLRKLMNTMKEPTKAFEALEVNTDSKLGQYIDNIKNNIMYQTFNSEVIYNTTYDMDYWLTTDGYAYVFETYTEILVEEPFPYLNEEKAENQTTTMLDSSLTVAEDSSNPIEEDKIYEYAARSAKKFEADSPDFALTQIGYHLSEADTLIIYINGTYNVGINIGKYNKAAKYIYDFDTNAMDWNVVDYKISVDTELNLEKVLDFYDVV